MSEILSHHVVDFIRKMIPPENELLTEIAEECRREYIPLIEIEVGQFLQVLLKIKNARRILELGTAIGYSTLWMAQSAANKDMHITTVEIDKSRYLRANENFLRAEVADMITSICGDAREVIPKLEGTFDFIFIDAAKGQYPDFFSKVWRLLEPGGVIVMDNIFLNGWVIDMSWPERRKKTMVVRIRELLEELQEFPGLSTTIVPLGDGLSVNVRGCEDETS